MFYSACLLAVVVLSGGVVGCDSSSHPDSGYGANETPPSQVSCANLCARLVDCGGHLCAEDTGNTAYIDMFNSVLLDQCLSTCTDAAVQSKVTGASWQCLYEMSCRKAVGEDACHVQANYHCQ
jgi:hypothetical protein